MLYIYNKVYFVTIIYILYLAFYNSHRVCFTGNKNKKNIIPFKYQIEIYYKYFFKKIQLISMFIRILRSQKVWFKITVTVFKSVIFFYKIAECLFFKTAYI